MLIPLLLLSSLAFGQVEVSTKTDTTVIDDIRFSNLYKRVRDIEASTWNGGTVTNPTTFNGTFVAGSSATFQGYTYGVVSGTGTVHVEWVQLSTTKCTSTPCTIARKSPGVSQVNRQLTGGYDVAFTAGTFLEVPTCSISGFEVGTGSGECHLWKDGGWSSTSIGVICRVTNGTSAQDDSWSAVCFGQR